MDSQPQEPDYRLYLESRFDAQDEELGFVKQQIVELKASAARLTFVATSLLTLVVIALVGEIIQLVTH